jgi:hypothetical protein
MPQDLAALAKRFGGEAVDASAPVAAAPSFDGSVLFDPARKPASAEDFRQPTGLENAISALLNVAQGFGKGAVRSGAGIANAAAQSHMLPGLTPQSLPSEAVDAVTPEYENTAERIGGGAEMLAELALPGLKAAQAVPRTARAGARFQEVMGAAKDIPVDISAPGDVALRIAEMAQHGGGTNWGPAPVRQFIQYVTDPKKPPMTYEVARDFASNISRLSVRETLALPPAMKRQVTELKVVLNKAVADAAQKAGKGAEYKAAMREYAQAMKLRETGEAVVKGAKKALPIATLGGGGAYLLSQAAKKIRGE